VEGHERGLRPAALGQERHEVSAPVVPQRCRLEGGALLAALRSGDVVVTPKLDRSLGARWTRWRFWPVDGFGTGRSEVYSTQGF
jgi:hypothetical protein